MARKGSDPGLTAASYRGPIGPNRVGRAFPDTTTPAMDAPSLFPSRSPVRRVYAVARLGTGAPAVSGVRGRGGKPAQDPELPASAATRSPKPERSPALLPGIVRVRDLASPYHGHRAADQQPESDRGGYVSGEMPAGRQSRPADRRRGRRCRTGAGG